MLEVKSIDESVELVEQLNIGSRVEIEESEVQP